MMKFCANRHFIYITTQSDEHKEQLQLYYKLMEEEIEEITKDWLTYLLILENPANMFDPNSP
jgi:hypothetical protein